MSAVDDPTTDGGTGSTNVVANTTSGSETECERNTGARHCESVL